MADAHDSKAENARKKGPVAGEVKALRVATIVLLFVCIGLVAAIIAITVPPKSNPSPTIPSSSVVKEQDPNDLGVFDELTKNELYAIWGYLLQQTTLGLTTAPTPRGKYVFSIEIHRPPKREVLEFLNGGVKPTRMARVLIIRGDLTPPVLEEYVVGPLPKPTNYTLYVNPSYRKHPIPYNARPRDNAEFSVVDKLMKKVTERMYHILEQSYGFTYHNCTTKCLSYSDSSPPGYVSGERNIWYWFVRDGEGGYLNPVGLQFLVNLTHPDPDQWFIAKIFYNDQIFGSVDQFIREYDTGNVTKVRLSEPDYENYSSYGRRKSKFQNHDREGPKMTLPSGPRFTVNGRYVEYMDWSFHFSLDTPTGFQLFDIRFRNDRVAYELGIQEAAVTYSGYNPTQSAANLFDRSWNMYTYELIKGVDCPEGAVYFDVHSVYAGFPSHMRNAACLFEWNTGIPLRRHYDSDSDAGYTFAGGLKDEVLIFRSIGNVANYDYIYDYIFHNDGVIEVRAAATGYLHATVYTKGELKYGFRMQENVVATIHNHFWSYKVDLDVAGEENRFSSYDIGLEDIPDTWEPRYRRVQKTLRKTLRKREKDARMKYDFGEPKAYIFHKENHVNKPGDDRAYRILPNTMSKLLYPDSSKITNGLSFAKYQLAVTRRKDEEMGSSSVYTQSDPWDPVVSLDHYIADNEDIVDKDLVAWVSLGMMHIPRTEDMPTVTTSTSKASFFIVPFNYHREDPSMSNSDHVLIRPKNNFQQFTAYRKVYPNAACSITDTEPFHYNGTVYA